MTLVTFLSTVAMVLGLGGILPQLGKMIRSRSAGGQAVAGWGMGCAAHASMAYVNFFGFHSMLLSASNLIAELFGDRGRHARMTSGASHLPLNALAAIEAVFEIAD